MKYNTATIFATAAALASIASASASAACNQTVTGEPGEPAVCSFLPPPLPELPQDNTLDDPLPCVEVIFREDQCHFETFAATSTTSTVSTAFLQSYNECNCGRTTFADWLECQDCLFEHGPYREVSQLWFLILTKAKSALCNSYQNPYDLPEFPSPAQTVPFPSTPTPSITTIAMSDSNNLSLETDSNLNPAATITQAPWTINQTNVVVTAANSQNSCDVVADSSAQEISYQQETIMTTITASVTNQSFSAAVMPTDPIPTTRKQVLHLPPAVTSSETSNAVSSFKKPCLALAIVGGLLLGVL